MAVWVYNPKNGSFECTGSEPVTTDLILKFPATVRIGTSSNYVQVDENGDISLVGTATQWDDVYPSSVTVGTQGSNVPAFTAYNGNLKAYEFHGAVNLKEINLGFQLNHSYKVESTIVPHIHVYAPSDGSGGVVKFGCEYTWASIDSVGVLATTTVYGTVTLAASTVYNNKIISFGNITGTGKGMSSVFMCRLFRDPTDNADTFGSSVWLKSADIHIEKDTIGSRQELVK